MIFLITNKIPPLGDNRVPKKLSTSQCFGRKVSTWTLDTSEINHQASSTVSFLRRIRPKFYGDSYSDVSSGFLDSTHALHHQLVFDAYFPIDACLVNGNWLITLESEELSRKVRHNLYVDSKKLPSGQLSILPQINMGADPIINSAKVRQGSRHSNQGGK